MGGAETKAELRKEIKIQLNQLSDDDKRIASNKILDAIMILDSFKKANSIMVYASTRSEVDTLQLIDYLLETGKQIWAPWCDKSTHAIIPVEVQSSKDFHLGSYGILEPSEPTYKLIPEDFKVDIVFVPGVAFDGEGNRLGRGLGYYDKFLSKMSPEVVKIGLAFQCQMVDKVPIEEFDFKLDKVISA